MLFIIFIALGFASLVAALIFKNKLAIIGSIAFILLSIVIPVGIYSSNIGTIADLEAFFTASSTNFQVSRDDTASYLSEEKIESDITLIPITGSIERLGVGQSTADRVLEYRNAVNSYNTAFAKYRAYKNSALFGIAYPEVPSHMRLLVINPVDNESPNNYKGGNTIQPENPDVSAVPAPQTSNQVDQESLIEELLEELKSKE